MEAELQEKIEVFFKQYKFTTYKKGELLVRAEEDPVGVFYLTKGLVKEYIISHKGEEIVVNIFKPFAFFPMSWVLNGTSNAYFFEAMDGVEVWRAPKDAVNEFVKKNPDVLYDLLKRVFKGTDGLLRKMTFLMAGNANARLITDLLIYAKRFEKDHNEVELHISEKDIAAQTGMTRETVSREMKVLKEKGIVSTKDNRFIIENVDLLEKELAGGV